MDGYACDIDWLTALKKGSERVYVESGTRSRDSDCPASAQSGYSVVVSYGVAMMFARLALFVVFSLATPLAAWSAEIALNLSGDAFQGGPAFLVSIDDEPVGEGTVDPVPDGPDGAEFTFTVPDSVLAAGKTLQIRLTNDHYKEGVGDRNLRIVSARVGEVSLVASDFDIVYPDGYVGTDGSGLLTTNSQVAVADRPASGWVEAAVAPVAVCDESAVVAGYANGVYQPTEEQNAELAPILNRAKEGDCSVTIRGYASTSGPEDANQRVSEVRAKAVLEYLVQNGASFTSTDVAGVGETEEFGPSQADNRRVTVQLAN